MATYLLADIAVTDAARFNEYREKVEPLLARFGARYLARGGDVEVLEGTWEPNRLVLLEFPSRAAVEEFYHSEEYAPLLQLRLETTDSKLMILEGYEGERR